MPEAQIVDMTAFTEAAGDVVDMLGTTILPAMVGVAVAGLGIGLAIGWIRRIRSAV